ncbi:MAG: hypothetical protein KQI62_09525 [Deltaproteobacteria bacterium]|nr:hypothetical protein [Deltaproteobacteria bacterium]
MSALAALCELGAQVRLAPDGRLVVAGLDRLPKHQAAKAVEVAAATRLKFWPNLAPKLSWREVPLFLEMWKPRLDPATQPHQVWSLGPAGVVVVSDTA